jgi:hypothetical protein
MTTPANERREFIRVPFRTEIEIHTPARTIRSRTSLDISMNGLRTETAGPAPEPGTPCHVRITLSREEPQMSITVKGVIVRAEPGTLAIHFSEIDVESYLHLQQLILNNSEDPARAEQEFRAHRGIRSSYRDPKS